MNRDSPKTIMFDDECLDNQYRTEVIAYFIDEAQALILDDIVMPTMDPRFEALCCEMAGLLECHVSEAVKILGPASRALCLAAQAAADRWRESYAD